MGRKKRKPIKPWCWYCNREFEDDKILAQHQRAKHFKCPFCHKKLYSGPGLTVHCVQVHKEKLNKIPEALPNRNSVDIDIYGMQGVPEEDIREHERLKRGDDSSSKPPNSQQGSSQTSKPASQVNRQFDNTFVPNPSAMHAAMYQQAMGMGVGLTPGFPIPPPGMPMPPTGFPLPPPGFPGMMYPPPIIPGMPPNMAINLIPPPTMANVPPPPMSFPTVPPPPPPQPTSDTEPVPSSSSVPPPPPMSGVGQLIGIPPPSLGNMLLRPPQISQSISNNVNRVAEEVQVTKDAAEVEHSQRTSQESLLTSVTTTAATSVSDAPITTSSKSTIAKPALILASSEASNKFIDLPTSKMRIMHPTGDVSLEELRLRLYKYQTLLREKQIDSIAQDT